MTEPGDIPPWDEALAALLREEYARQRRTLVVADLEQIAAEHGIRFDDLVVTLFQLCIHGHWRYRHVGAVERLITRAALAELARRGRLHPSDLREYSGNWRPLN